MDLTFLVQTLETPMGNAQQERYGECPNLNEGNSYDQVNALGGYQGYPNFQGPPRPYFDPYASTYNDGWWIHPNQITPPNFSVQRPNLAYLPQPQPQPQPYPFYNQPSPPNQEPSLDDLVR